VLTSDGGEKLPPHQVVDNIAFVVTPDYKNPDFLQHARARGMEPGIRMKRIHPFASNGAT